MLNNTWNSKLKKFGKWFNIFFISDANVQRKFKVTVNEFIRSKDSLHYKNSLFFVVFQSRLIVHRIDCTERIPLIEVFKNLVKHWSENIFVTDYQNSYAET